MALDCEQRQLLGLDHLSKCEELVGKMKMQSHMIPGRSNSFA